MTDRLKVENLLTPIPASAIKMVLWFDKLKNITKKEKENDLKNCFFFYLIQKQLCTIKYLQLLLLFKQ